MKTVYPPTNRVCRGDNKALIHQFHHSLHLPNQLAVSKIAQLFPKNCQKENTAMSAIRGRQLLFSECDNWDEILVFTEHFERHFEKTKCTVC